MERYLSAVCLAVLLTWNGAVAQGKTVDEIADDHACSYFRATDPNHDKVATVLDYIFEWLSVPFSGSQANLIIDLKRQVDIMQQYINVFPLTDTNILQSLLKGGVKLEDFIQSMRGKRNTAASSIIKRAAPDQEDEREERAAASAAAAMADAAAARDKRDSDILNTQIGDLVRFLMKVFNYDGNELSFTLNELQILWHVVRLDDAPTSFAHLDKDASGTISYSEYYVAGINFFNGVQDGNCEYFAGPPTTCDYVRAEKQKWIDLIATGSAALPFPAVGSIGDVNVLTGLLSKSPAVQAQLNKIFTDFLGIVPAALSSLVGVVGSVLGTLGI